MSRYGKNISDPDAAAEEMGQYLQRVYDTYAKPIWLTEFALINFADYDLNTGSYNIYYPTWDNQARFATVAIAKLNALPFVERYAWFAMPAGSDKTATNYLASGGSSYTLTKAGQSFKNA